jgi:hypothetical protein
MEDTIMKKLATLLLIISLSAGALAQRPGTSNLNITLHDNAIFNITVNGISYNYHSDNYQISNLEPGRHYIEIVRFDRVFNGHSYRLVNPRVIFRDYIRLGNSQNRTGYINHRGRFIETSRIVHHPVPPSRPSHPSHSNHHPVHPVHPVHPGHTVYKVPMNPAAFSNLMHMLHNTSFDSRRLSIAKQAISAGYVTSGQVRDIMTTLSFEKNRLEIAKFAFNYTVDPQNYFLVNSALKFNSSTRSLNQYIAMRH